MSKINDGGPAFATSATATSITRREDGASVLTNYGSHPGMSLRDYFAAAALASMTVAPDYSKGPCDHAMAERAYIIADEMLKAREVKP